MTLSEENYIKTIYHLTSGQDTAVSTNAIAERIDAKASSVTDMIKKLADKKLVTYVRYQGVRLTGEGLHAAVMIVRKHRIWEVFLVEKLEFNWDEVHEIAEQLEHIKSEQLIDRLDQFLGHPSVDPHGDPIPDAEGNINKIPKTLLAETSLNETVVCVGVKDSSADFLKYLDKQQIALGTQIKIMAKEAFDGSMHLRVNGSPLTVTHKAASNLYVRKV